VKQINTQPTFILAEERGEIRFRMGREQLYPGSRDRFMVSLPRSLVRRETLNAAADSSDRVGERVPTEHQPREAQMIAMAEKLRRQFAGCEGGEKFVVLQMCGGDFDRHAGTISGVTYQCTKVAAS
jgi:hypothetical protein